MAGRVGALGPKLTGEASVLQGGPFTNPLFQEHQEKATGEEGWRAGAAWVFPGKI